MRLRPPQLRVLMTQFLSCFRFPTISSSSCRRQPENGQKWNEKTSLVQPETTWPSSWTGFWHCRFPVMGITSPTGRTWIRLLDDSIIFNTKSPRWDLTCQNRNDPADGISFEFQTAKWTRKIQFLQTTKSSNKNWREFHRHKVPIIVENKQNKNEIGWNVAAFVRILSRPTWWRAVDGY